MTREEEILIEKVIWLIEDSYPDTDEWGHDTLFNRIKEDLIRRADELSRMFEDGKLIGLWHKASEELPKDDTHILMAHKMSNGNFRMQAIWYPEPQITDDMEYWMPIPEIKEEQK